MTTTLRASRLLVLAGLVVATTASVSGAQTISPAAALELSELVLRDGSQLFGTVESQAEDEIVFRVHSGSILKVPKSDVISLQKVTGRVRNGEFYRSDTHRTRLFFAPTARSLRRGETSLGMFQVSIPFVQVGITNRISLGGGTPLFFGFDESHRPYWLTPKIQVFDDGKRQAAVGVLHLANVDGCSAGIAYGVGTFGSDDDALTVGAGLAYSGDSRGGVLMIGGERRVRPNLKLVSENYVFRGGNGLVSGGVRFIGERLSADVGLVMPLGGDFWIAVPVVNFVYVFGPARRQ
jgi:hypothetical protein